MLEGRFDEFAPGPSVLGTVWIENYSRFIQVRFLLDFSCPVTVVAAGDIARGPLPLDDIELVQIDDRPPVAGISVPALIALTDDDWRYTYNNDAILSDECLRSRLGWDVLSQWTSVMDPETGTALFDPRSLDARSPL